MIGQVDMVNEIGHTYMSKLNKSNHRPSFQIIIVGVLVGLSLLRRISPELGKSMRLCKALVNSFRCPLSLHVWRGCLALIFRAAHISGELPSLSAPASTFFSH